jgi:hypothetical protein
VDDYEEYLAEMAAIPYEEKHRPQNQDRIVEGFCINPALRDGFDQTSNEDRHEQEIRDWWGRPFILEQEYEPADESYTAFVERLKSYKTDGEIESQGDWETRTQNEKQSFDERFPSGKAYTVRCLHGGAWDRSSWCGDFPSLDEALAHAHSIDGQVYLGMSYKLYAEIDDIHKNY